MCSSERETCLKVHLDYRCRTLHNLPLWLSRFLLPVCICRAWTGVCSLPCTSQREILGALKQRSTGTPGGSRPAPSARHIVGGLGLLYPGMTNSEVCTNTHGRKAITKYHMVTLISEKGKHKYPFGAIAGAHFVSTGTCHDPRLAI